MRMNSTYSSSVARAGDRMQHVGDRLDWCLIFESSGETQRCPMHRAIRYGAEITATASQTYANYRLRRLSRCIVDQEQ
jgi:hypothetical protein